MLDPEVCKDTYTWPNSQYHLHWGLKSIDLTYMELFEALGFRTLLALTVSLGRLQTCF